MQADDIHAGLVLFRQKIEYIEKEIQARPVFRENT